MVQAKIFISFWLKPNIFCNLAIPDINVGATLNNICVTSVTQSSHIVTRPTKFLHTQIVNLCYEISYQMQVSLLS
jgi:hypothetical protein